MYFQRAGVESDGIRLADSAGSFCSVRCRRVDAKRAFGQERNRVADSKDPNLSRSEKDERASRRKAVDLDRAASLKWTARVHRAILEIRVASANGVIPVVFDWYRDFNDRPGRPVLQN